MKKQLVINEQKLKFYSTNQLRYSDRMRSNFREEISDKDTLVNYILEQLKCNKVDEVSWSCFLQELMGCIEIKYIPETFEELKELCEDLESKNVFIINAGNCIEFNGLYFWKDGSITTTENNNDIWATKMNLTPARQWQIIKSLIGEK